MEVLRVGESESAPSIYPVNPKTLEPKSQNLSPDSSYFPAATLVEKIPARGA